MFQTRPLSSHQPVQDKSGIQDLGLESQAESCVESLRRMLESRLDHMIKFLELDTSGRLPEPFRAEVLQAVREAMGWQSEPRSASALQQKIEDMDNFMTQALKQHGMMQ